MRYGRGASTREGVVHGEVALLGAALGRGGVGQPLGRSLSDVLVQPSTSATGEENSLDGPVLQGAVVQGMGEGLEELGGVVALAQRQHLPGVVGSRARLSFLQRRQEGCAPLPERVEGAAQQLEGWPVLGVTGTMARENRLLLGTARE